MQLDFLRKKGPIKVLRKMKTKGENKEKITNLLFLEMNYNTFNI